MNQHVAPDALTDAPREAGPLSSLAPRCQHCGEPFAPRGPGKPQKFCSPECRRAFHDGPAIKRGQTSTFETEPPALPAAEYEKPSHGPLSDYIKVVEIEEPWGGCIDRQCATKIQGVENHGSFDVHIEQEMGDGSTETATVIISAANAVRFARMVLWAAGFKSVNIAARLRGGLYEDIEDGAEANQFKWSDPAD